jgi:ABC-type nitrate/sulfonate/bicarbonate transport system substrate-binding protein
MGGERLIVMADHLLVNVFNEDAALIVARARRQFSANDLEVEVMVTPNSTDQMRGLSKGSWQIVSTAFDNVLGWSGREGTEIVAVSQLSQGITLPVYVRPEIEKWSDLRGKKLAVDAVDTAYALVLRRIILEHGLDLDRGDYELVPLGTTGARLESMTRGETFAGVLNSPWDKKAEVEGHKRFADHREVLPDYPGGVFAVGRNWAGENRRMLVNFLRAWNGALRWCHDDKNRSSALQIIGSAEKLDEAGAARKLAQLPKDAQLNLPGLQTVLDLRVRFGLTPPMGQELSRYFDASFYQEALAH